MKELMIPIKTDSKIPLYEQIYQYIREEIKGSRMQCDTRLPSTRTLSSFLQVSRSTVELAYAQLTAEGYIHSLPCKGYYVSDISLLYQLQTHTFPIEEKTIMQTEQFELDFSLKGIDMDFFPYNSWRKITREVLSADNKELFLGGATKGDLDFRETVSVYLRESRGVNCSPHQIIIGAGNEYLLMLLYQIFGLIFQSEKVNIAMENPTYIQAYKVLCGLGGNIIAVPVDGNGMSYEILEHHKDAQVAYIMPSHQFPTGNVMPMKRRLELLKWANEKENRYIIEDDYDSEFRYKGKPIPALQGMNAADKVVYMGTFSKSIAPAIRVSYLVLPPMLMEIYEKKMSYYANTVPRLHQKVLESFIRQEYYVRHLNRMRSLYKNKHDLMINLLKEQQMSYRGENVGLHLLVEVKNKKSEQQVIHEAKRAGVKIYGLSHFAIAPLNTASTVLLGFGSMKEQEIEKGMHILENIWK